MLTIHPVPLTAFSIYLKGRVNITTKNLCQVNIHLFLCLSWSVPLCVPFTWHNFETIWSCEHQGFCRIMSWKSSYSELRTFIYCFISLYILICPSLTLTWKQFKNSHWCALHQEDWMAVWRSCISHGHTCSLSVQGVTMVLVSLSNLGINFWITVS